MVTDKELKENLQKADERQRQGLSKYYRSAHDKIITTKETEPKKIKEPEKESLRSEEK